MIFPAALAYPARGPRGAPWLALRLVPTGIFFTYFIEDHI